MEQSLLYIKRTYFPELTANAGYGFNNSTQTSNNSFQVGVNLNSTVNLMELKHNIKGADAQVNLADNEIILFKKIYTLRLNVHSITLKKVKNKFRQPDWKPLRHWKI